MAIQTKTYNLSQQPTADIFPERKQRAVNSMDVAIRWMEQAITCADNIKDFGYNSQVKFKVNNEQFIQEAKDFLDKRNISYTNFANSVSLENQHATSQYLYCNLAFPYLVYKSYFKDYVRKRFDRNNFTLSYNEFDGLREIFQNRLNLNGAIQDKYEGDITFTEDNEPKGFWKQAANDIRNNIVKTRLGGIGLAYSPLQFKSDCEAILAHFKTLKNLFNKPEYGVTRLWLKKKTYGPYNQFIACIINTQDDAKELLGFAPKDNPTESEILEAQGSAKKKSIDLSYKSTKSLITNLNAKGTPLAFAAVPNDIPASDKDTFNYIFYAKSHEYIGSPDNTDIEKLDYIAKKTVRSGDELVITAVPSGNDNTIVASGAGTTLTNQAAQTPINTFQQTPPEKVEVDKEAIQEQTELF